MEDFEDYFIEDILKNKNKKKRKNVSRVGKTGERELKGIFSKRFPNKNFYRTVGSGNRYSQVNLSEDHKAVFVGDVISSGFNFVIECKYGYADTELCDALENGHKTIDGFLEQVERDSKRVNKQPLLCWRKQWHPWLAFVKSDLIKSKPSYCLYYGEWIVMSLDNLLKHSDDFFFK